LYSTLAKHCNLLSYSAIDNPDPSLELRVIPPGAIYRIFYMEAGITVGGSCYSLDQLVWSTNSFFDSFARGDFFADTYTTKTALSLFRRILVYFHRLIGQLL
jgi:hypothetical protein